MHFEGRPVARTLKHLTVTSYGKRHLIGAAAVWAAIATLTGAIIVGPSTLAATPDSASSAPLSLIDPAEHLPNRHSAPSSLANGSFSPRWVKPSKFTETNNYSSGVEQVSVQTVVEEIPERVIVYQQNEPTPVDPPEVIADREEVIQWDNSDSYTMDPGFASGGSALSDCSSCGTDYDGFCQDPCMSCCTPYVGRLWVRPEYLLWWTKGFRVPPLVTTSSDTTPTSPTSGALGQAGTTILFGNELLNNDVRSAGRIGVGYWLDPCKMAAIEGSYIGFGEETSNFAADSTDYSVLTRPYHSLGVLPNADWAWPVSLPPLLSGNIAVNASTDFHSAEVLLRRALYSECNTRLDFVAGYRFARLNDDLQISHSAMTLTSDIFPTGTVWNAADQFSTQNEFHGAELGVIAEMRHCRWSLETLMKLSLGGTNSTVDINGNTTLNGIAAGDGGVLTRPSNIGTYSHDEFTMIPELGATLGYDLTCNLRFMFGYTFMYWSKVSRPGEQIDLALELDGSLPPRQVAGSQNPEFPFATTDFWAQGLSFGLDYRF